LHFFKAAFHRAHYHAAFFKTIGLFIFCESSVEILSASFLLSRILEQGLKTDHAREASSE